MSYIMYDVHVQNKGWIYNVAEGETGGTTGQSLRMEAIVIHTDLPIKYRVHIQNQGWQGWKLPGEVAGTTGQSLRMEGIEIRKQDDCTEDFKLYYRLHVMNVGWYAWAQLSEVTGTTGESRRAEAIQITTQQPEALDSFTKWYNETGRRVYDDDIKIYFQQNGKTYEAAVIGEVTLSRSTNAPSCLSLNIKRGAITPEVGNLIYMKINGGHNQFKGYIFKTEKHGFNCDITAYDQMIYMQLSKDSRTYKDKTAKELLLNLCDDYGIHVVDNPLIDDTKYKIPERVEDNVSLLDMMINAIDLTRQNTGVRYHLWDDFGSISLQREDKMVITTSFISQGFIDDFRYTEDLSESYTVVKVVQETDDKDKPKEYIVKDDKRVEQYGRIQYYEKLNKDEDGDKKAKAIYDDNVNLKTTFSVSGVQGDIRARGGTPIYVDFHNQDRAEYIRGWYRIDSATHHFVDDLHTMDLDLTLIGSMDANGWTLGEKWIKEA